MDLWSRSSICANPSEEIRTNIGLRGSERPCFDTLLDRIQKHHFCISYVCEKFGCENPETLIHSRIIFALRRSSEEQTQTLTLRSQPRELRFAEAPSFRSRTHKSSGVETSDGMDLERTNGKPSGQLAPTAQSTSLLWRRGLRAGPEKRRSQLRP